MFTFCSKILLQLKLPLAAVPSPIALAVLSSTVERVFELFEKLNL